MHSTAFIIVASTLLTIAVLELGAFLRRAQARAATVNAPKWVGLEYLAGQNGEDLIDVFCFVLWWAVCDVVVYFGAGTNTWPADLLGLVPGWLSALLVAIKTTRESTREAACAILVYGAGLLALYLLIWGALYVGNLVLA